METDFFNENDVPMAMIWRKILCYDSSACRK